MADKKINVSAALPPDLVVWADEQINNNGKYVSRSHILTVALANLKKQEEAGNA
jgi:Arc/MetJ-type ribon-helix-helix transcriptional regulator